MPWLHRHVFDGFYHPCLNWYQGGFSQSTHLNAVRRVSWSRNVPSSNLGLCKTCFSIHARPKPLGEHEVTSRIPKPHYSSKTLGRRESYLIRHMKRDSLPLFAIHDFD
ncbi:hypothetical protein RSOL_434350 [Rhizoctonia solani AG-3 Rhs1AP]|uniref:Uncharacterized protein n=2 Tax=Rhizoctonia solani AG-3 TaxID=1086053 RepID=A0A074S561_9AGAM|nr:hypothetical protein RSOL_434350 [Rhizoctonia solani AG-3 Rhs1AP]KEP54369.1 hypothetical protein V565_018470 [Rhizoctonia solani 123E]